MSEAPREPSFGRAGMLALVEQGRIESLRQYFDTALSGNAINRPEWLHLRAALRRNDLPMMRLLVTWGAVPNDADLHELATEMGENTQSAFNKLRIAGLNLRDLPAADDWNTPISTAKTSPSSFDTSRIPQEWKTVLASAQKHGAPEALIVGGALRDIFNDRSIKDVDIFVKAPLIGKKNFLKKIFKDSGLKIHGQYTYSYDGHFLEDFKRSSTGLEDVNRRPSNNMGSLDAWMVIAGPNKTHYHIVFVNSPLFSDLRRAATKNVTTHQSLTRAFLDKIDLGLCQIAYDGKNVLHTFAYDDDVAHNRITLCRPEHSSIDHIRRVATKYGTWTLCKTASKALQTRRLPVPKAADANYLTHYVTARSYM